MKVIIFGTENMARTIYDRIHEEHEVIGFTDSSYPDRWGSGINGVTIYPPKDCLKRMDYDKVIIACSSGMRMVYDQCLELGVPETKIDTSYVEGPIKSRDVFLKNMAGILNGYEQDAQVAEAGVFLGDFAKRINQYFPERVLHLFDTFEGFDERDFEVEHSNNYSDVAKGLCSGTSVELVMSKMPYPDKCRIHKGYFPETARDVDGKFCFVNLDMDLYNPTYNGLWFFQDKMTEHGVILVHDYFFPDICDTYKGVKAAVDKFVSEYDGKISKYPVGDGFSIMLAGEWKK